MLVKNFIKEVDQIRPLNSVLFYGLGEIKAKKGPVSSESDLSVRLSHSKSSCNQNQSLSPSPLCLPWQHVPLAPFCLHYYVCVGATKNNHLLLRFLLAVNFCPGE